MAAAKELIDDAKYLAYKFNFNTENVEFLPVDRSEIRRVNSLSREVIEPGRNFISLPLSELVPLLNSSTQSLHENSPRFIFHTAFCSSTFLSRCLDVEGISACLREPQILLDAANAKRLQWRSRTTSLDYRSWPKLALLLLQKHAASTEKLIIKPINSVNNIIPELMQVTGSAKSLMLYTDARNFLLSTLKKGEDSKYTVRAMFDLIRCDFPQLANLRLSDTIHMTDLKVILTLWRLQIEQAEQALKVFYPKRAMSSLYGERLIASTREALLCANRFLELDIPDHQIEEIVNSDQRFADAKNTGERFSVAKRTEAYQKLEQFYGDELDKGLNWMIQSNPGTMLVPELTGTLGI